MSQFRVPAALSIIASLALSPARTSAEPPADEALLAGPSVVETTPTPTLVKRDMSGNLEILDRRPEIAAVDLLGLTPQERAPIDEMLTQRAAAVSSLLRDHYPLFLKLQGARQGRAGPMEMAPLIQEFRPLASDLLEPPLADRITPMLPDAKRPVFRNLIDEYLAAWSDNMARERSDGMGPARATPAGGPQSGQRTEIGLLLREIARTLAATVEQRREQTDALLKRVQATPEQEAKIRAILRGAGGPDATEESRRDVRRRIAEVLTAEQRSLLRTRDQD
jgi:hypothetical protein